MSDTTALIVTIGSLVVGAVAFIVLIIWLDRHLDDRFARKHPEFAKRPSGDLTVRINVVDRFTPKIEQVRSEIENIARRVAQDEADREFSEKRGQS